MTWTPNSETKKIIAETAEKHGITVDALMNRGRKTFAARAEAIVRVRQERKLSLSQIGNIFNRDHTTVLNAIRRHKSRA